MTTIIEGIYTGNRDNKFKEFIKDLVMKSNIRSKYINILIEPKNLEIYNNVFTSELVDIKNNYQVYEQLGDLSCNKFIVSYMYKKFPHVFHSEGVKIVARLRINYCSKEVLSSIAEKLGFWYYITAPYEARKHKMKDLLEDVFEAFIGATEYILDSQVKFGVGYVVVYKILNKIFDSLDISLNYNNLFDAKTRLKEIFDSNEQKLGQIKYKYKFENNLTTTNIFKINQYIYPSKNGKIDKKNPIKGTGEEFFICSYTSALKNDSEQKASEIAISLLEQKGYTKKISNIYSRNFTDKPYQYIWDTLITNENINELKQFKPKLKYQNKYKGPIINYFFISKDIHLIEKCLTYLPDFNIKDTDGLYPIDIFFIGIRDDNFILSIIPILTKYQEQTNICFPISSNIYKTYLTLYLSLPLVIEFKKYLKIVEIELYI